MQRRESKILLIHCVLYHNSLRVYMSVLLVFFGYVCIIHVKVNLLLSSIT